MGLPAAVQTINNAIGGAPGTLPFSTLNLGSKNVPGTVNEPVDPRTGAQAPLAPGGRTSATAGPAAPTAAQVAAANKAAADAAAGAAINAGYGQVINGYDRQINDIPNQINEANQIVGTQYGSQKGSIESAYGRGNANLQFARDTLTDQTKKSIQKLAQSIRQSFDSYGTMIGAGGGGDSSATGQLSYALQKSQAQNRSDIYQNENQQMGSIGLKQGDLDAQHSDQLQQLESWRSQQIISIGQQFRQAQMQLEQEKAGANKDKLLALASLNQNLVNQAVAALSGVEAQHAAASNAIKSSIAAINTNTGALSGANYTVDNGPGVSTPQISMGNSGADGSFSAAVPYYKKLTAGV